ncbi:MAG: 30S ribosomal protein S6e [Euryarchaeota archaeon]|nr:30S ribosomal protein S6e [Euryarchaeota archaeon]
MAEFKVNVSNADGKSYQVNVSGHHANSLVGKRIGEEVDGLFVSLPGYKLKITGGSDKDGFVMRRDLDGIQRKRILISTSTGFRPKKAGMRRRKTVRGNTVSLDVLQINMAVTKAGSKPIDAILAEQEKKE